MVKAICCCVMVLLDDAGRLRIMSVIWRLESQEMLLLTNDNGLIAWRIGSRTNNKLGKFSK